MDSDATGSGARGYGTIKTVDIISNFDKNLINGTRESRASYYCTRILLTSAIKRGGFGSADKSGVCGRQVQYTLLLQ